MCKVCCLLFVYFFFPFPFLKAYEIFRPTGPLNQLSCIAGQQYTDKPASQGQFEEEEIQCPPHHSTCKIAGLENVVKILKFVGGLGLDLSGLFLLLYEFCKGSKAEVKSN
jgi:hypothetical protein